MRLLNKTSAIILVFLFVKYFKCDAKSNGFSINISKQKSPLETFVNSVKELDKYDINFSNVFKGTRTNDSVALYRYLDNEYYAQIRVGKPSQLVNLAFDTAWPVTWVMSEQCSWTKFGCIGHNKYDHTKSSYYKKDGQPFIVEDEGYNLTGFYSYDTLYVSHINVTNQKFVEMTSVPSTYSFSKIDGMIGLGLQIDEYVPLFYNLLQQKKITNSIFSIYLNRDTQSNHGGNIMLGFYEKRHIHSHKNSNNETIYDDILYLPVKSGPYWEFDLDRVFFNGSGEANLTFCTTGCTALTDTSSNSIYGPANQVNQIHISMKAKPWFFGRYSVSCDTIPKLPNIVFYIGEKPFSLKGRDYTIKMTWHSLSICLSAFIPDQTLSNQWALGGAFLSEYYSIYDLGKKQIGLVKAAP